VLEKQVNNNAGVQFRWHMTSVECFHVRVTATRATRSSRREAQNMNKIHMEWLTKIHRCDLGRALPHSPPSDPPIPLPLVSPTRPHRPATSFPQPSAAANHCPSAPGPFCRQHWPPLNTGHQAGLRLRAYPPPRSYCHGRTANPKGRLPTCTRRTCRRACVYVCLDCPQGGVRQPATCSWLHLMIVTSCCMP
jgi:hypothetical protein